VSSGGLGHLRGEDDTKARIDVLEVRMPDSGWIWDVTEVRTLNSDWSGSNISELRIPETRWTWSTGTPPVGEFAKVWLD
jgi:hypothetical protein